MMRQLARACLRTIAASFRWWLTELAALIPARLRSLMSTGLPRLAVDLDEQVAVIRLFRGDRAVELDRIARDGTGSEEAGISVAKLAKRFKLEKAEVVLRLPPDQGLRQRLELPLMAESELREALYFQIDRHTPFPPDKVYYDYKVVQRDTAAEQLTVEMVVTPQPVVARALAEAERLGLAASVVDLRDDRTDAPPSFNLLRANGSTSTRRAATRLNIALAAIAMLVGGTAIYLPLARQDAALDRLRAEAAEAKLAAEAVMSLQETIEQSQRRRDFLRQEKRRQAARVILLEELSAALPDNTWLTQLSVTGNEVQVHGFSPAASELLAQLDQFPLFRAPKFRSPVTRERDRALERFNLSFELVPEEGEQ